MGTKYDEGDVVATPDGRGVVAAVLTSDVEFPQGSEDLADVSASDDRPAYVVGLEAVGSAVYRASALETSDLEDDDATRETDGEALTGIVDGFDTLPEGWDRDSVLGFWSSIGGSWDACVEEMTDEFGEERANEHCSAAKDEVVRTERWRNRF